MDVKFTWIALLTALTADATAQVNGQINLPPVTMTKVPKPQKADCIELNIGRGTFVVGDLTEWGVAPAPAQSGFCTADQPFQTTITVGDYSSTGPLQCPSEHFVAAALAEKLCSFLVRQNAAVVSLADRIDVLNQKLEAGVSHAAAPTDPPKSSGTLLKKGTH